MKNKLRYLLIAVLCISIFAISGCKGGDDGLHSSDSTPIQSGNADSSIENDGSESTDENNSSSEDDSPISNTRTITYILNGGVNHADNPDEFTIGSTVSLFEPTRVGFIFDGWYLNEACTGERITELSSEYETNVILYAQWTEKSSELPIRPIS